MKATETKHIMLAGPSGIGKTTIAKDLSTKLEIPFLSGSVSDLLPQTRGIAHKDMISRDPEKLYMEDFQIMNLRNKLFLEHADESFVSDRSFLDSAAYFLMKQASVIPECEMENFLDLAKRSLCTHCSHLIVVDFLPEQRKEWFTENNDKRITSNYFQIYMASIMKLVLDIWNFSYNGRMDSISTSFLRVNHLPYGAKIGTIKSIYGETRVLILKELEYNNRKEVIRQFLKL